MTNLTEDIYEDLSDRQRAFVEEYCRLGGGYGAQKQAVIAAGYAEKTASQQGYALLQKPKILEAIKKTAEKKGHAAVAVAMDTLIDLARAGPPAQRFSAAKELLDRGGLMVVRKTEHDINVNDNRTPDQIQELLKRKIAEAPPAVLEELGLIEGPKEEPIDAEFEEIDLDGELNELAK